MKVCGDDLSQELRGTSNSFSGQKYRIQILITASGLFEGYIQLMFSVGDQQLWHRIFLAELN